MKLKSIEKSDLKGKKWKAIFDNNGRDKTIHFGATGYDDYTISTDNLKDRQLMRERYRKRHSKDLLTDAGKTGVSAGALSYWILWGDSTSMTKNITDYKRQFNL